MFVMYNSDAGFVAVVKSSRIMLNGVHGEFIDLKKTNLLIQASNPSLLRVKNFSGCNRNFFMTK